MRQLVGDVPLRLGERVSLRCEAEQKCGEGGPCPPSPGTIPAGPLVPVSPVWLSQPGPPTLGCSSAPYQGQIFFSCFSKSVLGPVF